MWGLLSGYITYIKAFAIGIVLCGIFYAGFHLGNSRYIEYKASVEATAKIQEAHNQAVEQQHELINKGIQNEYEGKLAALRNYYGRMQLNPSSGSVSGISPAPKGTDAETAYPILARQCAETTAQLTSLQDWINQQVGIK
jgi:hypothetical protein